MRFPPTVPTPHIKRLSTLYSLRKNESWSTLSDLRRYFESTTNEISADVPFSETVLRAKQQGYSEPDPRIDLSGKDVVRKLVILAREAGYKEIGRASCRERV